MARREHVPLVLLASLMTLASLVPSSRSAEIAWAPPDFAAAAARAGNEGKLIHVFVEGDNCPPCDIFKNTHLRDPAYVDFVSTLFVNIRAHEDDPSAQAFLRSLNLIHAAVPRFYVLDPEGRGISMAIGMVAAAPMEGAEVFSMANGRRLPVNRQTAAGLAARIRAHAASVRTAGTVDPTNPLRPLALAALEAQAWALAGRLDEAEKAFGADWAPHLAAQEIRDWYVNFWLGWNRNLAGALAAARILHENNTDDTDAIWLLALALAANNLHAEAVALGERLIAENPDDRNLADKVADWRRNAAP